jgi:hypothetical protein
MTKPFAIACLLAVPAVASADVMDVAGNSTLANAQPLVASDFGLGFDPNVGLALENTSETVPYARVIGTNPADPTGPDYFSFSVPADGSRAIFDIDGGSGIPGQAGVGSLSARIGLWEVLPAGGFELVRFNDNPSGSPDNGVFDPFLNGPRTGGSTGNEPLFEQELDAGDYVVGVSSDLGGFAGRPDDMGFNNTFAPAVFFPQTYELIVSVSSIPEPTTALAGLAAAGLVLRRTRRSA